MIEEASILTDFMPADPYASSDEHRACIDRRTDFIELWSQHYRTCKPLRGQRRIGSDEFEAPCYYYPADRDARKYMGNLQRPNAVRPQDLVDSTVDWQGMDWSRLRTSRRDARMQRNSLYRSSRDITRPRPRGYEEAKRRRSQLLPELRQERYFDFAHASTTHNPQITSWQSRQLLAVPSTSSVIYARDSEVIALNTSLDMPSRILDLATPTHDRDRQTSAITSLAASHEVLALGTTGGEFALKSLLSPNDGSCYTSTFRDNGSSSDRSDATAYINHVHIHSSARRPPCAIFACNDSAIRTVDITTQKTSSSHTLPWAVNSTCTSPDSRLRLVVGDDATPLVLDAQTGASVCALAPHADSGFATAWSPCGRYLATGNQDETVAVFDARCWARRLTTLYTETGCARSLSFAELPSGVPSPAMAAVAKGGEEEDANSCFSGGGSSSSGSSGLCLIVAESADIVSVVNTRTWRSRQRLDFWGEIGGVALDPGGEKMVVAIADERLGGLIEFDRAWAGRRVM